MANMTVDPKLHGQRFRNRGAVGALILALVWLGMSWQAAPVRADAAPPEAPPGANPMPNGEVTQVRMVSETVLLDILPGTAAAVYCDAQSPDSRPARAQVEATFLMRNLGSVEEQLAVRFPLSFWDEHHERYSRFPEITDLRVEVAGQPVPTRRTTSEPSNGAGRPIPWATFDVIFPPDQDVPLKVFYMADGPCRNAFITFGYVLETGAGWKDSIGRADLIVRLPYDVNALNFLTDFSRPPLTSAGATMVGHELRWHYENLEPSSTDNLAIELVWPANWQRVLTEKLNVQNDPNDGEAWGRLGKVYKELLFYSGHSTVRGGDSGQELYRLSVEAYAKAVALLPQDALWHAGFAELLLKHYFSSNPSQADSEAIQGVEELNRSLALDSNNQKAQDLIKVINRFEPSIIVPDSNGYVFLAAVPPASTATSAVQPSSTSPLAPTEVPPTPIASTSTEMAIVQAATPIPPPEGGSQPTPPNRPICGAGLALPMLVVLGAVLSRTAFPGRRRDLRNQVPPVKQDLNG